LGDVVGHINLIGLFKHGRLTVDLDFWHQRGFLVWLAGSGKRFG